MAASSAASSTPPAAAASTSGSPGFTQSTTGGHSTTAEGWECPNCGKVFAREDLLRRHLAREARALAQPALDRQKSCYECARSKARCDLEVPSCGRCRAKGKPCTYAPRSGNPNVRRARAQGIMPVASPSLSSTATAEQALNEPAPVSHFGHGSPYHHPQQPQPQPSYAQPHQPYPSGGHPQPSFYPQPAPPAPHNEFAPSSVEQQSGAPWPSQSPCMGPASEPRQFQPTTHEHLHQHQLHPDQGHPPHHQHYPHQHHHQHHHHHHLPHAQHSSFGSGHDVMPPGGHNMAGTPANDSEDTMGSSGGAGAGSSSGWLDALRHMRSHRALSVSTDSMHTSSTHTTGTDAHHHHHSGSNPGNIGALPPPPPQPQASGSTDPIYGSGSGSGSTRGSGSYPHVTSSSGSSSLAASIDYSQSQHPAHQPSFLAPQRTDSPASFMHTTSDSNAASQPTSHPTPHPSWSSNAPPAQGSGAYAPGPPPPPSIISSFHQPQPPYRRRTSGIITNLDRSRPGFEKEDGEETPLAGPPTASGAPPAVAATMNAPGGQGSTASSLLRTRHSLDPRNNSFSAGTSSAPQNGGNPSSPFQKSASVGMFDLSAFGAAPGSAGLGTGSIGSGDLLSPTSLMGRPSAGANSKLRSLPSLNTSDTIRSGAAANAGVGTGPGLNTALRSAIFNSLNTADISRWLEEPVIASPLYRMGPSFDFATAGDSLVGFDAQNLMGMGGGMMHLPDVGGVGLDAVPGSLAEMTASLSTLPPSSSDAPAIATAPPIADQGLVTQDSGSGSNHDNDAQMKPLNASTPQQQQQQQQHQRDVEGSDPGPAQKPPGSVAPGDSSGRPVINALQWWTITQASPSLPQAFVEDLARSCASHFLTYPTLLVLADPTAPVPPFMHRAWLALMRPHTPRALAVARVILAGHHVRLPTSEDVVWAQIANEVRDLVRTAEDEIATARREAALTSDGISRTSTLGSAFPNSILPSGDKKDGPVVPDATQDDLCACMAFASASALWFYIVLIILSDEPASGRHVSLELLNAALCTLSELTKIIAERVQELDQTEQEWKAWEKQKEEEEAARLKANQADRDSVGSNKHETRQGADESMADKQARLYRFGYMETLRRTAFACYGLLVLQRFREGATELQSRLGMSAEIVLDLALPAPASVFEAGASPQWERAQGDVFEMLKGKRDCRDKTPTKASVSKGHGGLEPTNGASNRRLSAPGTMVASSSGDATRTRSRDSSSSSSSVSSPSGPAGLREEEARMPFARGAEPHSRYTLRDLLEARSRLPVGGRGLCPRMTSYLEYADGFTHVCLATAMALDGDLAEKGTASRADAHETTGAFRDAMEE
ncbi:hypothetical protein V8E36_009937 [Tilletia maclaganii]